MKSEFQLRRLENIEARNNTARGKGETNEFEGTIIIGWWSQVVYKETDVCVVWKSRRTDGRPTDGRTGETDRQTDS